MVGDRDGVMMPSWVLEGYWGLCGDDAVGGLFVKVHVRGFGFELRFRRVKEGILREVSQGMLKRRSLLGTLQRMR